MRPRPPCSSANFFFKSRPLFRVPPREPNCITQSAGIWLQCHCRYLLFNLREDKKSPIPLEMKVLELKYLESIDTNLNEVIYYWWVRKSYAEAQPVSGGTSRRGPKDLVRGLGKFFRTHSYFPPLYSGITPSRRTRSLCPLACRTR